MEPDSHKRLLPIWIGILLASWPFNIILGKIALRYFPSVALASFRLLIAAVVMVLVYAVAHRKSHPFSMCLRLSDLGKFSWLGLTGVILNQGCFIVGMSLTSAAHSALIIATGPITIFVLAWIRDLEVATWRKIVGLTFAFCGVFVLTTEKGFQLRSPTVMGDLITVCGSIGFALYTISARPLVSRYDTFKLNMLSYVCSAVISGPIAIFEATHLSLRHNWHIPYTGWLSFAYIALSGSVMAMLIYAWALRYMAPSRVGALTYIHPVVASTFAVLWLGEPVTTGLVAGGLLVLVGLYFTQSGREMSSGAGRNSSLAIKA